jgi:hypothetical protein
VENVLIIPVNELVEGDLLGRGLYAPDGRLMLKEGITLNSNLIDGIKKLGHRYISVESSIAVPTASIINRI